jgi:hypothetical protein
MYSYVAAHPEAGLAALASLVSIVVSIVALVYSIKSAKTATRSAKAAEESNEHSKKSADAADVTGKITQASFENEAKRNKARVYWMLYRIHTLMDAAALRRELFDLSPIQDFLHIYGHTLDPADRDNIQNALNGMELLVAREMPSDPGELELQEKIHRCVMEAAMALREEWMGRPT